MNSEQKILLLLGGTGFIGRAVAEKYLKMGWRVIVPTRDLDINNAKEKLINHGFDKTELQDFLKRNQLLFIFGADLNNSKWKIPKNWYKEFKKINIEPQKILRIINFVTDTSGRKDEIIKSNVKVLESIFMIIRILKSINKKLIFCNMGSVAEKRMEKNLPPYELAKKIVREEIYESGLCDFHFVAHYVKGKGEQKMKLAAPFLWSKLKISYKWLFGFKVSIIDVDDLAEIIYHLLEVVKIPPREHKPIEINVTNGELLFGEMIKNLLPEDKRIIPNPIIPSWLEKLFLLFYSLVIPLIKPNDQLSRRLANFAKRAITNPQQLEKQKGFKTAEEIKNLALDTNNYKVLETTPNLIIVNKHHPVIYVLKEKTKKELEQIVQKALTAYD